MGLGNSKEVNYPNIPTYSLKGFLRVLFGADVFAPCCVRVGGGFCIFMINPLEMKLQFQDSLYSQTRVESISKDSILSYRFSFENEMSYEFWHNRCCKYNDGITFKVDDMVNPRFLTEPGIRINTIQSCLYTTSSDLELLNKMGLSQDQILSECESLEKIFSLKVRGYHKNYFVIGKLLIEQTGSYFNVKQLDYIYYLSETQIVYRLGNAIYDERFELKTKCYDFEWPNVTIPVITIDGTHNMNVKMLELFGSPYINNQIKTGKVQLDVYFREIYPSIDFLNRLGVHLHFCLKSYELFIGRDIYYKLRTLENETTSK